jgi:hypothetical protein
MFLLHYGLIGPTGYFVSLPAGSPNERIHAARNAGQARE